MKTTSILSRVIMFVILLLSANKVFSQDKFEISGGLGLPVFTNLRIKYGNDLQIGACMGLGWASRIGYSGEKFGIFAVTAEIYYHFLGKSQYVDQKPWYILGGFGYFDIPWVKGYEDYDIGFYPAIGKYFNFSKRIGINCDIGAYIPFSAIPDNQFNFKILPAGNISFFIRL